MKLSTPRARDSLQPAPTDIGRPLSDITSTLRYDESARRRAARARASSQTIEREVQTRDGRWHLMRLLPYRTTDDRIDGVVITFQDITSLRQAEDAGAARARSGCAC